MQPLLVEENDKILIIAPHPDDECIGTGGLLLNYGKQCNIWVLTNGCQGKTHDYTRDEISEVRKREFISEMESLGIHSYRMFGLEDGCIFQSLDFLLEEDFSSYTKIFVSGKEDSHLDHRAAFWALIKAMKKQALQGVPIYQYRSAMQISNPTHGIFLDENIYRKLALIRYHESQIQQFDYCMLAQKNNLYLADNGEKKYIETYEQFSWDEGKEYNNNFYLERSLQKQKLILNTLDWFTDLVIDENSFDNFFQENGYECVAVYGYGILGRRLVQLLERKKYVNVKYIIDQNAAKKGGDDERIVEPSPLYNTVSLVIVTAVYDYGAIKTDLVRMGYRNVMVLDDMMVLIKRVNKDKDKISP